MSYSLSFGALIIFFIWVAGATFWWRKRLKRLENEADALLKGVSQQTRRESNDSA